MKKKKQKWEVLNMNETAIFTVLTYLYYYCLLCLAAALILLIIVIISGNSNPVFDAIKNSTESSIIIAVGSILFLPVTLSRNKYIKQLRSKRDK